MGGAVSTAVKVATKATEMLKVASSTVDSIKTCVSNIQESLNRPDASGLHQYLHDTPSDEDEGRDNSTRIEYLLKTVYLLDLAMNSFKFLYTEDFSSIGKQAKASIERALPEEVIDWRDSENLTYEGQMAKLVVWFHYFAHLFHKQVVELNFIMYKLRRDGSDDGSHNNRQWFGPMIERMYFLLCVVGYFHQYVMKLFPRSMGNTQDFMALAADFSPVVDSPLSKLLGEGDASLIRFKQEKIIRYFDSMKRQLPNFDYGRFGQYMPPQSQQGEVKVLFMSPGQIPDPDQTISSFFMKMEAFKEFYDTMVVVLKASFKEEKYYPFRTVAITSSTLRASSAADGYGNMQFVDHVYGIGTLRYPFSSPLFPLVYASFPREGDAQPNITNQEIVTTTGAIPRAPFSYTNEVVIKQNTSAGLYVVYTRRYLYSAAEMNSDRTRTFRQLGLIANSAEDPPKNTTG